MRLVERVHELLREHVHPGDRVVDGTAGNGHDTALLAELVGPTGRVFSFDIQEAAIRSTAERLQSLDLAERVTLLKEDHSNLSANLDCLGVSEISAAVFNLGYFPGGDHALCTRPQPTLKALSQCALLLAPRGLLCVTVYRGHKGGQEEADAVRIWIRSMRDSGWKTGEYSAADTTKPPPSLWTAIRG